MLAVIGIGGAGGNIANFASEVGYQAGAINFSQKDLDSANNLDLKLKLVGSEGVGHNREEAIRLMSNNWENAVQFVEENFSNPSVDVIVVPFSTGGGSGSGIAPLLLDILSQSMDKTFVAMPIIPDKSESVVSQINCLKTFEELSNLDVSVFPIDNHKVRERHDNIGKNRVFEITNSSAISALNTIIEYTEMSSKNGNIDRKDVLTILGTKGFGTIAEVDISKVSNEGMILSHEGVADKVCQSWNNSIFADISLNKVVRAGVVFDGQESLMQYVNHESLFKKFGNMPIDVFEGNYHEQNGKIITIMSGLGICRDRLLEIEEIVNQKQDHVQSVLDDSESYTSSVSAINDVIRKPKPKKSPAKKRNIGDILSKYQR